MNRKTVLILGIALLLVGFSGFLLTSKKEEQGISITQQYSAPSNIANSASFEDNSIVYSNSHELVEYSLATGETHNLSANVGLNNIDTVSVSPNSNYIVFHDPQVAPNDALSTQLQAMGFDQDAVTGYWWLYNVQANTFKALPPSVLLAKVDNNNLYTLSGSAGSEAITTYSASTLQQHSALSISGSSNFFAVNGGFLLQSPNNDVLFTKNGVVSQELYKSSIVVGVSNDGHSVAMVTTQGDTKLLNVANLSNNKIITVADDVFGAPVWQQSGAVLYNTTVGNLYEYTLATNKNDQWELNSSVKIYPPNITLNVLAGPTAAIVSNQQNDTYLVGAGLSNVPAL